MLGEVTRERFADYYDAWLEGKGMRGTGPANPCSDGDDDDEHVADFQLSYGTPWYFFIYEVVFWCVIIIGGVLLFRFRRSIFWYCAIGVGSLLLLGFASSQVLHSP